MTEIDLVPHGTLVWAAAKIEDACQCTLDRKAEASCKCNHELAHNLLRTQASLSADRSAPPRSTGNDIFQDNASVKNNGITCNIPHEAGSPGLYIPERHVIAVE